MSPFLQEHFSADTLAEVPADVVQSSLDAARNVLANPTKFPNAIPGYHRQLLDEIEIEKALT